MESREITTAGLRPDCSEPRTGSGLNHTTSPRWIIGPAFTTLLIIELLHQRVAGGRELPFHVQQQSAALRVPSHLLEFLVEAPALDLSNLRDHGLCNEL